MKFLVSGAKGLIGASLVSAWRSQGHHVLALVRPPGQSSPNTILWDPPHQAPDLQRMEGLDAVVHLSGAPIARGRWTPARKEVIRSSRIDSTRLLAHTLSRLKTPPKVWINASAVGFYGNRGQEILTEKSAPGHGFLSDVCKAWEAAADLGNKKATRIVHLRTGIVLSLQGGTLPLMKYPFQWGLGGPLGSGHQYISWITLEDVCGIIRQAVTDTRFHGPINVVSPAPVTNLEFSKTLAATLHRPCLVRVPASVARFVLGEMADALLFSSIRAKPAALEQWGYRFLFPDLSHALQHLLRP